MKLLMLIVDEERKEELEVVLRRSGVTGYTELPHATGFGATGQRLGSASHPKTSAVILTLVEPDAALRLAEDLKAYCADCKERVKMITWTAEQIL